MDNILYTQYVKINTYVNRLFSIYIIDVSDLRTHIGYDNDDDELKQALSVRLKELSEGVGGRSLRHGCIKVGPSTTKCIELEGDYVKK